MRSIGLHLRLTDSLLDLAHKAIRYNLPLFQCFLSSKNINTYVQHLQKDQEEFIKLRHTYFTTLFAHGSYWINLANDQYDSAKFFKKELKLAKQFGFTHFVLHPGAASAGKTKQQGIQTLARKLNTLLKHERDIRIVLENGAHGNVCIGSDLNDFTAVLSYLNHPEKVLFCIDTAHAYVYGYSLESTQEQEYFIHLIDQTVGLDRLCLIHLNDTQEACGSKIDKHEMIGNGLLGTSSLKNFIFHPRLHHIPVLMEPPPLEEAEEVTLLHLVRSWHISEPSKEKK